MGTCIVCGVDGSGGGWRAASVAAGLARTLRLPAVLVHVREDLGVSPVSGARGLCRAWRTRKRVQAIARERWFPAGVEFRQRAGDAAHELLLVAEQEGAELVVVASGGSGRGRAILVGGVASALMHRAPCPVVVVPRDGPPPADAELTRSVVCPIESREADVRVLRFASDLASRLEAALHAVHGYEHNGDARPHVLERLTADALLRVAERERGMIVVGPPSAREARSLTGGRVALPVVADALSPVVVLPPRAALDPGSDHYRIPSHRP